MEFKGADILSATQFNRGDIETVLTLAKKMEPFATKKKWSNVLDGKLLASLFYEPSTRTRMSFEAAMQRLGGRVVSVVGLEFSSLTKGETLYDTGKIIEHYGDLIVMRHPEDGSVTKLASGASIPVINAGDGVGEHPTQSLLDLYTMQKERDKIDGMTVAMVGDLKYGRTVHSLSLMLSHYDVELIFVSPPELKMPEHLCRILKEKGVAYKETADMGEAMKWADVLYMTRIQQERFKDGKEYEKHKNSYILRRDMILEKNQNMLVMHPLPRIWEIHEDVDEVPGAAYFRQVGNGVAVRMALMTLVLGKKL